MLKNTIKFFVIGLMFLSIGLSQVSAMSNLRTVENTQVKSRSKLTEQRQAYLQGKHWVYVKSSGNLWDRVDLYLYKDGTFEARYESGGFSGGPTTLSMASEEFYQGAWRVMEYQGYPVLAMKAQGANEEMFLLEAGSEDGIIRIGGATFSIES